MIVQLVLSVILLLWPTNILGIAASLPKSSCPPKCGNFTIPYPFGIGAGCYIGEGFAIDCKNSKPFLKSINLEVLKISIIGTVRVKHPIISFTCDDYTAGNASVDLRGSPFVFSQTHNRFTGVGCDNAAFMEANDSTIGGCLSICDRNSHYMGDNSCYGIECCQTTIPSYLKIFNASITRFNVEDTVEKCKYAFLVDQEWLGSNYNIRAMQRTKYVPVVLDLAIDERTFYLLRKGESSMTDHLSYNCTLITSRNLQSSIQCSCMEGFQGNPYLPNGCQDIDECEYLNICPKGRICENYIGGYTCYIPESTKSRFKILMLGVGTGLGLLFLLIGAWWLYKATKKRKDLKLKKKFFKRNGGLLLQQQLSSGEVNVDRIKMFNSKELEKATDHFNVNRMIGQGGQGTVYKGMLADGRIVAVKRSKVVDEGKLEQFINEVVILSQINHRNVVKILGCCLETEVPLLVYEFIPSGTLFQYLHDQNEEFPLTWDMRLRIAKEVAIALSYLHSEASLPIYHRDIKSTNILLDDKYRAKVADFGTSRSIAIDQTHVTTQVQGTFGYLDPEFFQSSQFTEKSDVYSFGVVLVELLTGEKPISSTRTEEGKSLVMYFIVSVEQNLLFDILDAQVIQQGEKEEIMVVANLAKRCLNLNGKNRPTMKEVAMELEAIQMSQKFFEVLERYDEVEYTGIEVSETWDGVSSSTSSGVDVLM